jgi:4-diphosphocytidyl-2-C-methyl-D-erythritol kinase
VVLERVAPAKVNLFLHVGAPGEDGYHPIASLMVFADAGDQVTFVEGDGPGLRLTGPFAGPLTAGADNLVVRARDRLLADRTATWTPFHLVLDKQLPIASGLGGGSADAAAVLVLLRRALGLDVTDAELLDMAGRLGSDVPACLKSRSVIATGRGDRLAPAPPAPILDAVLVNPLRPSPTGAVYKAYDRAVAAEGAALPDWPASFADAEAVAAFLGRCRNDLQAPAIALQPAIADVLAALGDAPETLMARMSGSGATCFALCRSLTDAGLLAGRLAAAHPDWWVRPCRLGGSRPV